MNDDDLIRCLRQVAAGELSVDSAQGLLQQARATDDESAMVDTGRLQRIGAPEAVYGEGKSASQVVSIARVLDDAKQNLLVTRASDEQAQALSAYFSDVDFDPVSRTVLRVSHPVSSVEGRVGVICAGTTDQPVAEEAVRTLSFLGVGFLRFYDVGVAGLHRILNTADELRTLDALIVVAGMDGALPAVVGGLVPCPVIAVPTSVGYGAAFSGLAPLLGMLNACSAGVVVVNIDNGFGAARAAHRMLRTQPDEK
ncbi:MAG: nickel pincer cofactor biosynthesis protein LarB [Deltaproteobacteria bacterium]|nr:nickel pincer cofactor biosynthesis protein LarB [Deltaproteobacteria bacterium]